MEKRKNIKGWSIGTQIPFKGEIVCVFSSFSIALLQYWLYGLSIYCPNSRKLAFSLPSETWDWELGNRVGILFNQKMENRRQAHAYIGWYSRCRLAYFSPLYFSLWYLPSSTNWQIVKTGVTGEEQSTRCHSWTLYPPKQHDTVDQIRNARNPQARQFCQTISTTCLE